MGLLSTSSVEFGSRLSATCTVLLLLYLLRIRYSKGLNKFPGPFLASFTDLWKIWYVYTTPERDLYVNVHRKYGDIVRIGPKQLSFADPRAINEIYGTGGGNQKSDTYAVTASPVNGQIFQVLFSGTDAKWHDRQRRLLNPAFSMSEMIKYEPWVDDTINVFIDEIRKRFLSLDTVEPPVLDFMQWGSYYTVDAASEVVYGERTGFLEQGRDVNDIPSSSRQMMRPWLWKVQMPLLDKLTLKNPISMWLSKQGWLKAASNPYHTIMQRQFFERQDHWKDPLQGRPRDRDTLTDKFIIAQRENPDQKDFIPMVHSLSVMGAAGESNALTLAAIFYYLLKNARCYRKLKDEINQYFAGKNTNSIPYNDAQGLPYLNAVINEAMRCHWVTRMPMPRLTPPSGLDICAKHIAGNVDVNVCGPAVHRRKEIFGSDVDTFRPERWLEGDEDKARQMKNTLFTFSRGRYSCLGQNLARVQIWKFVPAVLRAFDLSLVNPEKDWTFENAIFPLPIDLYMYVREAKTS